MIIVDIEVLGTQDIHERPKKVIYLTLLVKLHEQKHFENLNLIVLSYPFCTF